MTKTKILYIDDEDINLRIFKINLGRDYDVITAESGASGLEILSKTKDIPVVITDMKMPHMDGIEFIRKAKLLHPDIIYFILSGQYSYEKVEDLVQVDLVRKFFRKPINLKEISLEIEKAIRSTDAPY